MSAAPHLPVCARHRVSRCGSQRSPQRSTQGGLALIGLMVSMTIGMLLVALVLSVFVATNRSSQTQDAVAQMDDNGRFALDTITRVVQLAGYRNWGGPQSSPPGYLGARRSRGQWRRWRERKNAVFRQPDGALPRLGPGDRYGRRGRHRLHRQSGARRRGFGRALCQGMGAEGSAGFALGGGQFVSFNAFGQPRALNGTTFADGNVRLSFGEARRRVCVDARGRASVVQGNCLKPRLRCPYAAPCNTTPRRTRPRACGSSSRDRYVSTRGRACCARTRGPAYDGRRCPRRRACRSTLLILSAVRLRRLSCSPWLA